MHLPPFLRSAKAKVAVFVATLLLAVATDLGTGLGTELLDQFFRDQIVSASSEAEIYGCGTPLYFTAPKAREILEEAPPDRKDWTSLKDRFGGAFTPTPPCSSRYKARRLDPSR